MKRNLILLALATLLLTSCYYNKEDLLYSSNCDTLSASYSVTVRSLLNNYGCLGCHVGINPSGRINLETYANVKTVVNSGRLYGAITHASGFKPMPDGAAKMNSCDINKIKAWIDAGTPEN